MSSDDLNSGTTFGRKEDALLGKIDQFELVSELGGGGFGTVYLARDTVAGIDVAVKGLPPIIRSSVEECENIRRNFALVSRLHHPNIAAALTLHPVQSAVYADASDAQKLRVFSGDTLVVMQYAPGVTISKWRKQFSGMKVPFGRAMEIIRQIASALDYAHKVKILHRDIKPANVMVETSVDGSATVRVLDFGLAAELRSSIGRVSTEIHDTSGTRPYMAPEQWCGRTQGFQTDQYALAVLLFELLCGEVPFASVFDTGDPVVMMSVVTRENVEYPPDIPESIRPALSKALSKKREDRFSSCMEFVDALEGRIKVKSDASGTVSYAGFGLNRLVASAVIGIAVVGLVLGIALHRGEKQEESRPAKIDSAENEAQKAVKDAGNDIVALKEMQQKFAEEERRAELQAFHLSAKALNARDLINGEPDETRKFFAAEIREFENNRRAGDDAKGMSKNIVATNLYAKALASASALKILVTRYAGVKKALDKAAQSQKRAADVGAEETLRSRYADARQLYTDALAALAARRFDESLDKAQTADEKFSSIRKDIIQVTFELAEGHKKSERWNQCLKLAEKLLEWEPGNARAAALRDEIKNSGIERNTSLAIEAFGAKRWNEGLRLSRNADRENKTIQFYLGVVYERGYGVDKNAHEAVKWYRKAAEQGESVAQGNLGVMYEFGTGVDKDFAEAVKWYRKSAEQGNDSAQSNLGNMYEFGKGVEKDFAEAVRWYRKSAEQGYARGQSNLGTMYEFGKGVEKDFAEAVRWYRKSAEQGFAQGQFNLGDMYEFGKGVERDFAEAMRWYRKAAEQGFAAGQRAVGYMYQRGAGVSQSDEEAVKWFRKAAEQGHATALNDLGFMYENGKGLGKDFVEAAKWYRRSADQGNAYGQCNLGVMYEYGRGVEKNLSEAVKWYRKSAERGHAQGQNNLGVMYEYGKGVEKNLSEAVKWYRKSAEQEYAQGQFNLGDMYEFGKGVVKNLSEAIKWYRKSALKGNASAKKALKRLGYIHKDA